MKTVYYALDIKKKLYYSITPLDFSVFSEAEAYIDKEELSEFKSYIRACRNIKGQA